MRVRNTISRILSFGLAAALTLPVVSALARPTLQIAADHKAMMRDALQESVNQLNLSDDQKSKPALIQRPAPNSRVFGCSVGSL